MGKIRRLHCKKPVKKDKGLALIVAMYTMIILAVLGTFFTADSITKSHTLRDYKDSQLALQMANAGIAFAMHYLGEFNDTQTGNNNAPIWANSITIALRNNPVNFSSIRFNVNPLGAGNCPSDNTLPANCVAIVPDPIRGFNNAPSMAIGPGRWGRMRIDLVRVQRRSLAEEDPYSVVYIEFTATGEICTDQNCNTVIATRNVVARARRNYNISTAFYQNWNGWELPGAPPPNQNDQTDMAAGVGDNFTLMGPAISAGGSPYASSGSHGNQSTRNTSGSIQIWDTDTDNPDNARFLGVSFLRVSQAQETSVVAGGTPNNYFLGPATNYTTPNLPPLPTGQPFAAATNKAGEHLNTAPGNMLSLYESAEDDNAVFVVPSDTNDVKEVKGDGTDANGYMVEKFPGIATHRKPGFAITEITFDCDNNSQPLITVRQLGYYSGRPISSSRTFDFDPGTPTPTLQNGIIYIQGGNVRVRNGACNGNPNNMGLFGSARVTIVANQGEAFYDSSGQDITETVAPLLRNATRYNSSSNGQQTFSGGGTYRNGEYLTVNNYDATTHNPRTNDPNYERTVFIDKSNWEFLAATQYGDQDPKTPGLQLPDGAPVKDSTGRWWWPAPGELDPNSQNTDKAIETAIAQNSVIEGNITIAGDITSTGGQNGVGIGLIARNYFLLNDIDAPRKAALSDPAKHKTTVQAMMLSTNHSMQWEGNTALNETTSNDSYLNYQGNYQSSISTMLRNNKGDNRWTLSLQGSVMSPFIDVDADIAGNGYDIQQFSSDPNILTNLPPGFPRWSFTQLRDNFRIPLRYDIINYTDKGAIKSRQ